MTIVIIKGGWHAQNQNFNFNHICDLFEVQFHKKLFSFFASSFVLQSMKKIQFNLYNLDIPKPLPVWAQLHIASERRKDPNTPIGVRDVSDSFWQK